MVLFLFWTALLGIFYVYAGYPLAVFLLGRWKSKPVSKEDVTPSVTVLIAAFNEEAHIQATVLNKLQLDYPQEKIDVIVISDGSEDGTDAIVQGIEDPRVRLLRQEPRAGKTSALNLAMNEAQGDIIVFSDANSLYAGDALRKIVRNFHDPAVGYVTGKMVYANPDGSLIGDGCSSYMKYENCLRHLETKVGSVVGVDGGIDAVRRDIFRPMNPDQLPDFVQPLRVVEQGYRVVYEPEALLWESALKEPEDEYRMRVRVSLRAFWALWDMRQLLGTRINPLFSWQLWSHKVLRYLCFLMMAIALIGNLILLPAGGLYSLLFLGQVVAYGGALAMPWLEAKGVRWKLLNFARYFLLLNLASAHAFLKFLQGKKQVLWTPRKG